MVLMIVLGVVTFLLLVNLFLNRGLFKIMIVSCEEKDELNIYSCVLYSIFGKKEEKYIVRGDTFRKLPDLKRMKGNEWSLLMDAQRRMLDALAEEATIAKIKDKLRVDNGAFPYRDNA